MAHIVIVGAGLGGMPAAYELREMLPKEHRITVVNPLDYFQFTPSNPWVAVGWRKHDAVTMPIAPPLQRKGIDFIAKAVTVIDAPASRLTLAGGDTLDYDYLVLTTGPKLSFDEVPGAGPHGGHTHSVCTVAHAEKFFAEYEEFLKNPGPLVIGAMPGASCFGPAYEFTFIPVSYTHLPPCAGCHRAQGVAWGLLSQRAARLPGVRLPQSELRRPAARPHRFSACALSGGPRACWRHRGQRAASAASRRSCRCTRRAMSARSATDNTGPGLRTLAEAMAPRCTIRCLRTARPMPDCCS